jgi:type VI secretion system FHA domain protein
MILTLEVVGEHAAGLGAGARKIFNAIGGTIGRLPDNDWVFADPYVSGRHALIRYLNGKYFIEDTSTNGVFINSPESRLSRTQPQQLRNGDLLFIDAYEIKVSIENEAASGQRDDPFARLKPNASKAGPATRRPVAAPQDDRTANMVARADADADEDDNSTEWFGMSEMSNPKKPESARMREKPDAVRPVPTPPKAPARRTPPSAIRPVANAPAHRPRTSSSTADESQLQALLAAAGVEGLDPSSEVAQTLGEVLRISVGGVMEVLRGRERMKDELRMRGTTFKAAHNNPLKFSANVDDAFHNLLVKHNPAYLDPAAAFEDAFRDVRDHQSAFLAAMRIAFEATLAHFDPNRLQEEFDRQMKGSILGVPAKLRYWDLYRDKYGDMAKDAEAAYRKLFGDEFAKAYEEQLERLKSLNRNRDK